MVSLFSRERDARIVFKNAGSPETRVHTYLRELRPIFPGYIGSIVSVFMEPTKANICIRMIGCDRCEYQKRKSCES